MVPPSDPPAAALERLLERHAAQVRRLAARYGLVSGEIDEILQEVRIRLWHSAGGHGNLAETPASYVYRTTVSAAIDHLRRRRARRETPVSLERPSGEARLGLAPAPDRGMLEDEFAAIVDAEVRALAADRAMVVRLHLAGYHREEIAQLTGWSEARTRHLFYRGLEELRARLRARGIDPEGAR
jgi:RNA polymerase sigma-70 factor (ECF subfamily)